MLPYNNLQLINIGVLLTTECTTGSKRFRADILGKLGRRKIHLDFNGGNVSSDGEVLLFRQARRKSGGFRGCTNIPGLKRYDLLFFCRMARNIFYVYFYSFHNAMR
jgi:hypothetical protein